MIPKEVHDRGVEADVKEERAFLHPQAQAAELLMLRERMVLREWPPAEKPAGGQEAQAGKCGRKQLRWQIASRYGPMDHEV